MTTLFASKFTKYSLYQLPHVHNKAVCFAGKSTTLPVLAAIQRSDLSRFTMVCYLYGKCIIEQRSRMHSSAVPYKTHKYPFVPL